MSAPDRTVDSILSFNREEFKKTLHVPPVLPTSFLGNELGARSDDETCYENDKVQYDRIAGTSLFQGGLDRVENGIEQVPVSSYVR